MEFSLCSEITDNDPRSCEDGDRTLCEAAAAPVSEMPVMCLSTGDGIQSAQERHEIGTVIIPHLKRRKLRRREAEEFAPVTEGKRGCSVGIELPLQMQGGPLTPAHRLRTVVHGCVCGGRGAGHPV